MARVSAEVGFPTSKIVRTDVQDTEQVFGSCLSDICRTLWPRNTAPQLASSVGCSVRAAEFWLAGDREWSGDAIAAIVSEILKRHQMRNVRVTGRKT